MAKDKTQAQILKELNTEFSKDAIMQVKQGLDYYDYVKSHYVIKRLNDTLGLNWSATTLGNPSFIEDPISKKTWVYMGVRLTIEIDGKEHSRDGWDAVEVKTFAPWKNGGVNPKEGCFVDLGNNLKQVYSQATKTAASKFGVALYLYFGGNMPDDEFAIPAEETTATAEKSAIKLEDNTKPIEEPTKKEIIEEAKPLSGTSFGERFSQRKVGFGSGFTNGRGSMPTAQAVIKQEEPVGEVGDAEERPHVFMITSIKNMVNDILSDGIMTGDLTSVVEELIGCKDVVDPAQLTKTQAKDLIRALKGKKGD